jgi:hypothetical protein
LAILETPRHLVQHHILSERFAETLVRSGDRAGPKRNEITCAHPEVHAGEFVDRLGATGNVRNGYRALTRGARDKTKEYHGNVTHFHLPKP